MILLITPSKQIKKIVKNLFQSNKQFRYQIFFDILLCLFVFVPTILFPNVVNLDKKCIWILKDTLNDKNSIDNALHYATQSNFDIAFIQIRSRGDAYYNSNIIDKHSDIEQDFDPLDYAIKLGHQLGIEIHVWMNCYILWSRNQKPSDLKHIYFSHPEWTEYDLYGRIDSNIDLSKLQSKEWEGVYLSPMHPEVNQYLYEVIREVYNNYNIDGVHFDYIRYQNDLYGFHKQGLSEFEKMYDINPRDIVRGIISPRFGWTQSYVDTLTNNWEKFKSNKITELLYLVKNDLIDLQRNVKISAAVKPNLVEAKKKWFQEWDFWIKEDLVDFVVPMNYFKDEKNFNLSIEIIKNNIELDKLDRIIMGIATYNQDSQSVSNKIFISRMNGFKGISIFSYDSHKNNLEWFEPVINSMNLTFD